LKQRVVGLSGNGRVSPPARGAWIETQMPASLLQGVEGVAPNRGTD
jgi:hypothetical protein